MERPTAEDIYFCAQPLKGQGAAFPMSFLVLLVVSRAGRTTRTTCYLQVVSTC